MSERGKGSPEITAPAEEEKQREREKIEAEKIQTALELMKPFMDWLVKNQYYDVDLDIPGPRNKLEIFMEEIKVSEAKSGLGTQELSFFDDNLTLYTYYSKNGEDPDLKTERLSIQEAASRFGSAKIINSLIKRCTELAGVYNTSYLDEHDWFRFFPWEEQEKIVKKVRGIQEINGKLRQLLK